MQHHSPSDQYQSLVAQQTIVFDTTQQPALQALDTLWQTLQTPKRKRRNDLARGIYLWGNVGRGKTLLMDLFYEALPEGIAIRQHFHHFMAALHRELNTTFGVADPVKKIAQRMAAQTRVLCFDEFFVSDIADAMLLQNMTQALFEEGVYLVATSNIAIQDLFQNQLQKDRFAPAIALLDRHFQAYNLNGEVDYRYRLPLDQPRYFTAYSDLTKYVEQAFRLVVRPSKVTLNGRPLPVKAEADQVLWCHFSDLCESPKSTQDFITLAQDYKVIIVSDIPELSNQPYERIKARGTEDGAIGSGATGDRIVELGVNDDAVRRFIALVDECYDQGVAMVFHAAVPLEHLYTNGSLTFEFRRTQSRITEMQTTHYLEQVDTIIS